MKRIVVLWLTVLSLLFFACTNISDGLIDDPGSSSAAANNSDKTVTYTTVSGTVNSSGALPSSIASALQSSASEKSARTAFPATPDLSGNTYSYVVKAINSSDSDNFYEGSTSLDASGNRSYSVTIPVTSTAKSYKISVEVKSGEITILKGESEEFDISAAEPVVSENVVLHAVSSGYGMLSLDVTVDSGAEINSAKFFFNDTNGNPVEKEADVSGTTYTFATGSVSGSTFTACLDAGPNSIRYEFYSDSGEPVYSFIDVANIYNGLTTNTWVKNGAEPYFVTEDGKVKCKITKALVDSWELTDIYVDKTVADDTGSGSFLHPKKTFNAALAKLHNKDKDYTIYIKGTLTGSQSLPATLKKDGSGTYNAKSLTICGATELGETGKPTDTLTMTSPGTVLTISTEIPVTIKNLKIEGGLIYANTTGISLESDKKTDVTISDGVLIQNNFDSGVKIGRQGKLTMNGGQITSNRASQGAGVKNNGTFIMNGGSIDYNITPSTSGCIGEGAGVYSTYQMIMTGGEIMHNTAHTGSAKDGGGVLFQGTFEFKGGKIYANNATNRGGGIYADNGTLFMSGTAILGSKDEIPDLANDNSVVNNASKGGGLYAAGSDAKIYIGYTAATSVDPDFSGYISSNYATEDGGGIFATSAVQVFKISGGTISNNAAVQNGGAIYAGGNITLLKKAYIPGGTDNKNDVYLVSAPGIVIEENLSATTPIATITPQSYSSDTQVLVASTGVTLANETKKFTLTQPTTASAKPWGISSTGYLKTLLGTKIRPTAAGDIVFNDGSATPYSSSLSLSDTEKAATIAVIFYNGNKLNSSGSNDRVLGVGLVQQYNINWCARTAYLLTQNVSTVWCLPDRNTTAGNYTFTGDNYKYSTPDRDGSNNLQQLSSFIRISANNDTGTASNYPAFYFGKNYKGKKLEGETSSRVEGTAFEEGWYLPTAAELFYIYKELSIVNAALEFCNSNAKIKTDKVYWSSSQDAGNEQYASTFNFSNGGIDRKIKADNYSSNCYTCAIRQFN